jgi:hypothetical protein
LDRAFSCSGLLQVNWMLNAEAVFCLLLQQRRAVEEDAAAGRERRLKVSLPNSALQVMPHLSPAATIYTGFIAAYATAPIFAVVSRAAPTFCDPKSR